MAPEKFTMQSDMDTGWGQGSPPYTAWPDGNGGFMVLDLRNMTWEAGPFARPREALEAMDRLNEQFGTDPQAT